MSTTRSRAVHNPRIFDDSNFVTLGDSTPAPQLVGKLLDRLGLRRAPFDKQAAGVRKWLDLHEPSPKLERSLRRNGFSQAP